VPIPDPFLYAERNGDRHVLVGSLEVPRVEALGIGFQIQSPEHFGLDELLAGGMKRWEAELEVQLRAVQKLGITSAVVPATFPHELAEYLEQHGIDVTPAREFFTQRRRAKNDAELAGIRRAQQAAEAGMKAGVALLRRAEPEGDRLLLEGEVLTCERIKVDVEAAFAAHDCTAEEFIVSHGAQTAIGHEEGSGPIAPGEPIVMDLFPRDRASGCFADMTRTFAVGTPSEELLQYHRLTREALDLAVAAIRPGVTGDAVNRLVCEFFAEHGQPTLLTKEPGTVLTDGFFHSLGHGVGLEVHEAPNLGRNGPELVAGDVVAVEPGLYRTGFGGCRLEDLVLVTEDGFENLTQFPYDLEP
jgi:Xaa-Pro aminopeptidase